MFTLGYRHALRLKPAALALVARPHLDFRIYIEA